LVSVPFSLSDINCKAFVEPYKHHGGRIKKARSLMCLTSGWLFSLVTALLTITRVDEARAKPKTDPAPDAKQQAAQAAKWLQEAFKGQPTPEAAEMLIAIAKGSKMGPSEGWFHAGQSRYSWKWLAEKHGVKATESIPKEKFLGSEAMFARLDRNKDGMLKSDDFDWSDRNLYAMQSSTVGFWFRTVNKASDGRLTREEWIKFFDETARGKDHMTIDDMRDAILVANAPKGGVPDEPTPEMLVRGLFRGEIGSMNEGPKLNDPAPDFALKSPDGKQTVRLSDQLGKKPVVLVFGNVTCGPFRAIYPRVDESTSLLELGEPMCDSMRLRSNIQISAPPAPMPVPKGIHFRFPTIATTMLPISAPLGRNAIRELMSNHLGRLSMPPAPRIAPTTVPMPNPITNPRRAAATISPTSSPERIPTTTAPRTPAKIPLIAPGTDPSMAALGSLMSL
jgi:hypothetical protein